ncbi:MlaD family protein [Nocardia altamirensis]|uniref:MlaD family protein n=1 Tax=Nocardia altamirensis TaxID=472158 RepID=UPI000B1A3DB7|nr:MlaD family protein [Nocardia altamirensis]
MNRWRRVFATVALGQAALLGVAGCAVDPARLTLPGAGVTGPIYPIHIQFSDALNLPSRAKVVANGARVGQLDRLSVNDPSTTGKGYAIADIVIQQAITLPAGTKVQLRQDTVLGDIYISLDTTVPGDGRTLAPGATIPVGQTEPALQIEDVIAGLATFVSGGALRSAQDIVEQVNAALPKEPAETARIASVLKDDLIDVSTHLDKADAFLDAISANVAAVQDNRVALGELLTPEGTETITRIAASLIQVVGVVGGLGGVAHALVWIAPLAHAGDAAAQAFLPLALANGRPLNLSAPSNLNRLVDVLRNKLIPFFERGPKLDIRGVEIEESSGTTVPADQQVDKMIDTLRMIGMVR